MPTGVLGSRCCNTSSRTSSKCVTRFLLRGLYKAITISPSAHRAARFLIKSHGVIKSLKLITAKSCINGAPNTAAAMFTALKPGTICTGGRFSFATLLANSITRPAIPYTPGSPLDTTTTL